MAASDVIPPLRLSTKRLNSIRTFSLRLCVLGRCDIGGSIRDRGRDISKGTESSIARCDLVFYGLLMFFQDAVRFGVTAVFYSFAQEYLNHLNGRVLSRKFVNFTMEALCLNELQDCHSVVAGDGSGGGDCGKPS